MSANTNIFLPLQFNQLVDLVKALPKKEKAQLLEVLQQEVPADIPEWQKKEVRRRITKYDKHPELLIAQELALKMIK